MTVRTGSLQLQSGGLWLQIIRTVDFGITVKLLWQTSTEKQTRRIGLRFRAHTHNPSNKARKMEKVTEAEVRATVEKQNIKRWTLRTCSMCNAPLQYLFGNDAVAYDSNCDCVSYWTPRQPRSYAEVADCFNMQTPEVRQRMWSDFASSGQPS